MQVAGTNVGVRRTSVSSEIDEKRNLRPIREALAWILLVTILWGTDLVAKILAAEQSGVPADYFRLVSEQVTSAIAALVMVLFLVQWVKLLPRTLDAWPRIVIGHFIGSVFFAFGHFALMVALRIPWYAINGKSYVWREPFVANLIVEYQKDIKIYIGFVVLISAYQYYRRSKDADPQPHAGRLVVQSGKGTNVLRFEDIDYLEAARNYVAVHAGDREYVVRDTMASLADKLATGPFERTHRSFIVNVDKVSEIRNVDTGQRIILASGAEVPLSRGYRETFTQRVGA
jgi:hypothetical protein